MASDNVEVHVNVSLGEKKQEPKPTMEGKDNHKETVREQKIVVSPKVDSYYEFEQLQKGDHVKGEISSSSPIDIYFLDSLNFEKWEKEKPFDHQDCNKTILETPIDYLVPRRGTWYVVLRNNGRESATVKVLLYNEGLSI